MGKEYLGGRGGVRKKYLWRKGRGEVRNTCGGRGEVRKEYLWRKGWVRNT